jgi:hypothetical protein
MRLAVAIDSVWMEYSGIGRKGKLCLKVGISVEMYLQLGVKCLIPFT